jgi:hypothetical protein
MTVLFFPCLHAGLVSCTLPRAVKFLNPGLTLSGSEEPYWRPQGLPLQEREALRYVQESLGFGEQFHSSREIAYFSGGSLEDFYTHTSQSIRSQFKRRQAFSGTESGQADSALQAQMILLLLWTFEEKTLEYQALNDHVQDMDQSVHTSLGIEDAEDAGILPLAGQPPGLKHEGSPHWSKVLPWFLFWMDEGDALFVMDRDIIAEWKENGVSFSPLEPGGRERLDPAGMRLQPFDLFQAEASRRELVLHPKAEELLTRPDQQIAVFFADRQE